MARLIFVSDLHLGPRPGPESALFLDLLASMRRLQESGRPQELYVLGDLFAFWIDRPLVAGIFRPVLDSLAALSRSGCPVTLLDGNRDFGGGRVLRGTTGARLAGERATVEQRGRRALLMHGDQLLTRDRRYQLFKRLVRSWPARLAGRILPRPLLLWAIRRLERISASEKARKTPDLMRLDPEAAGREAAAAGAELLIHGHTHQPGWTVLEPAGRRVTVFALGAWGDDGATMLEWLEAGEPSLAHWPPAAAAARED